MSQKVRQLVFSIHSHLVTVISMVRRLWLHRGTKGDLVRRSSNSVIVGAVSLVLRLVSGVLLARWLGVAEYGRYAFILAIVALLMAPATGGLATLVTRSTAIYIAQKDYARLSGCWRLQLRWGIGYGVAVALLIAIGMFIASVSGSSKLTDIPLLYSLPLFLFLPILRHSSALLNGLQQTTLGQLPEKIVQPLVFICLIVTTFMMTVNERLNAEQALVFLALAIISTTGIGFYWFGKHKPIQSQTAKPVYETRAWVHSLASFTLVGIVVAINNQADALMLGFLRSESEVGIYRVASHVAGLVVFFLVAVNAVIAPQIARLHAQDKIQILQRMLTTSARIILLGAVAVAIPFILFGDTIISFAFGNEYLSAYKPLSILCIGQVINATAGSVGYILNMTGNERAALFGVSSAAIVNVVLNLMLIPKYGVTGAATATATSIITWNVLLIYFVRKKTSLHSTALKGL